MLTYLTVKKLISYSHFDAYRDTLLNAGIEVTSTTIEGIFEEIMEEHSERKREADRLFFEHVFYGQLKNIYFHKINNGLPQKNRFIQRVTI